MFDSFKYFFLCFAHFIGVVVILKVLCCISPSVFVEYISDAVNLILCIIVARYTFEFTKRKYLDDEITPYGKAVLITGCDTGFGHELAKRLDKKGFNVFASCLFPSGEGAQKLKEQSSNRLHILGLDVTKDESVKEAFDYVKSNLGTLDLWAVVNNAGIQKGFTTDFASLQNFKDTMEVNGFGMVRVTKTFLPFLKNSKGRIVNITSFNGRNATGHNSPYCMSKFAAAGFSDCLRQELAVWGIRVVQIEPEGFTTNISNPDEVAKRLDAEFDSIDPELRKEYGEKYFKKFKIAVVHMLTRMYTSKISKVIDDLESAIVSEYPAISYKSSRSEFGKVLRIIYELMPLCMQDFFLNLGQYTGFFPKPIKSA